LRFYYVYNLPKVSTKWNVRAVRWVLDDWQLSGISQFQSGFPQSLNCQFTYPVNLFGGGDYTGAQVNGQLGQIISDYLPRQVQLVLKLYF